MVEDKGAMELKHGLNAAVAAQKNVKDQVMQILCTILHSSKMLCALSGTRSLVRRAVLEAGKLWGNSCQTEA